MSIEDVFLWLLGTLCAVVISVAWQRARPGPLMTREEHLEQKVKDLTKQVDSLQGTIKLLSSRIAALEKENARLRRVMMQATGRRLPSDTDVNEIRLALERLSANEVAQLAYDSFREVYNDFAADQSLQTRCLALMEYAENHGKVEDLRAAIEGVNEAAFEGA